MPPTKTFEGSGDSPNAAELDATNKADAGTYSVDIKGKVRKDGGGGGPNPIGDYKATLKGS